MNIKNLHNEIIKYCFDNDIRFTYQDPPITKYFYFQNVNDAKKVLHYLYMNHRKAYYLLNAYYINNKKSKKYDGKIIKVYDDYLFNCVSKLKYCYISYDY